MAFADYDGKDFAADTIGGFHDAISRALKDINPTASKYIGVKGTLLGTVFHGIDAYQGYQTNGTDGLIRSGIVIGGTVLGGIVGGLLGGILGPIAGAGGAVIGGNAGEELGKELADWAGYTKKGELQDSDRDGAFHNTPPGNVNAASGGNGGGTSHGSHTSRAEPGGSGNGGGGGGQVGGGHGSHTGRAEPGGSSQRGHESQASKNGFPIVLDMDRDNKIELALKSDGAFFDMDNDGIRDATAWVGKDDGLLVIDLAANGTAGADGVINQSSEVVFTNWVAGSTSDMAAVKAVFDSNKNGLLDAGDARFAEFRVWQDRNGDGISQKGELKTLTELGIKSIGLTPKGEAVTMKDGSVVTGTSTVTMTNGTTMLAGDSTFKYVNTGEGKAVEYNADGTPKTQAATEILGNSGNNTLNGMVGNARRLAA